MKKWIINRKSGLIFIYAVIVILTVMLLRTYTQTDADKLFLTPLLNDTNGWEIYTQTDEKKTALTTQELMDDFNGTFYLSRILTSDMERSGLTILELDGTLQSSVFLDGLLLYTIDPKSGNQIGQVAFPNQYDGLAGMGEYIRLTLPPHYAGKTLTIAMSPNASDTVKGTPMVRLSSESINSQLLISNVSRIAMPAAAYFVCALLLLGLFIYIGICGKWGFSLLLLVLAAFFQAFRQLLEYENSFSAHFKLNIPAATLLPTMFICLPMLFLLTHMRHFWKWYAPFIIGPMLLSCLPYIFNLFPSVSGISYVPFQEILYVSILALILFSILEMRKKNPAFLLFCPALLFVLASLTCITAVLMLAGKSAEDSYFLAVLSHISGHYPELPQYYCGLILFLLCTAVSFILAIKQVADAYAQLEVTAMKSDLVSQNLKLLQKSSNELAAARHNNLHHLYAMADLYHAREYERLGSYLREVTNEIQAILPIKLTEHPLINAILTRSFDRARIASIDLQVQIDLPEELTIRDIDLGNFLMNLMDNALEAVSSLPAGQERRIELTMHIRGHYLFIETQNTFDGRAAVRKNNGIYSSKKGIGHGYGIKTMSEIALRYQSKLQITDQSGIFIVRTALWMPEHPDNS